MIHFLKNLAIMGGLLYAAVYGAGRLSMDAGMDENETSDTITRREFRRAVNQ
jgi:putative oxidoreductase